MTKVVTVPGHLRGVAMKRQLKELVTQIDAGRELRSARDSRAYHEEGLTFAEYVRVHYGFSRQRAYQLIRYADIVEALGLDATPDATPEKRMRGRRVSTPEDPA